MKNLLLKILVLTSLVTAGHVALAGDSQIYDYAEVIEPAVVYDFAEPASEKVLSTTEIYDYAEVPQPWPIYDYAEPAKDC